MVGADDIVEPACWRPSRTADPGERARCAGCGRRPPLSVHPGGAPPRRARHRPGWRSIQQGLVLGVEAVEGTNGLDPALRRRAASREGPGGVLVKLKKPGQERRADLPTVGGRPRSSQGDRGGPPPASGCTPASCLVVERERTIAMADARRPVPDRDRPAGRPVSASRPRGQRPGVPAGGRAVRRRAGRRA